jgi:coatomer subunit epsilon
VLELGVELMQEEVLATIKDWLADPAVAHNASVLLVAGIIYTNEGDYVEALKALHGGELLEM